jgi:hypothetical protein
LEDFEIYIKLEIKSIMLQTKSRSLGLHL